MMIISQWKFEVVNWLRNGEQALLNFILPVMTLGVAHFAPVENKEVVVHLAIVGANVASAFTGLTIVMAFDKRYGVLKFYAASPLGLRGFYFAKVSVALTISLIQSAGLCIISKALGLPVPNVVSLLSLLVVATPFWVALAFIFASRLSAETVLASANALFVLLAASSVPMLSLKNIAIVNPVSAGLLVLDQSWFAILAFATGALFAMFVAKETFRWLD
jgi:ABC-2 type transport system permease protein